MRALLMTLALLLSTSTLADTDRPWWKFWGADEAGAVTASGLFTDEERRVIRAYYHDRDYEHGRDHHHDDDDGYGRDKPKKMKQLPPGLQKKVERGGELPPGWQMKVARGEVLAPDLYHGSRPLPEDLLERLGRHHHDSELRLLDDRVVRVVDDTRLILDVLQLY